MICDTPAPLGFSDTSLADMLASDLMGLAAAHTDLRPDTHEVVNVYGDVERLSALNHTQGDNSAHFQNTCGLTVVGEILTAFGLPTTENEVVEHAKDHGECNVNPINAAVSGTANVLQLAQLLNEGHVPAHWAMGQDVDTLAGEVRDGHAVLAAVNCAALWGDNTQLGPTLVPDHAVFVTGVATDPSTGALEGFYINDSRGYDGDAGRFISKEFMTSIFQNAGGQAVITDGVLV